MIRRINQNWTFKSRPTEPEKKEKQDKINSREKVDDLGHNKKDSGQIRKAFYTEKSTNV